MLLFVYISANNTYTKISSVRIQAMTNQSVDQTWIDYRPQFAQAVELNLGIKINQASIESDAFHKLFENACQTALMRPNPEKPNPGQISGLTTSQAAKSITRKMLETLNISYENK